MKKLLLFVSFAILIQVTAGAQTWNEVIKAVAFDRAATDFYGYSVAVNGDYALVGSYLEDEDALGANNISGAGSVYIFERNGTGVWNMVQKIVASDRGLNDQFGYSLAISGDYAIVGARWGDDDAAGNNNMFNAGTAYVFERNGAGVWNEVQKIVASDRANSDEFGYSVSISGTYAVVGAYEEDEDELGVNTLSGAGSAYIFERNGAGVWNQVEKIVASDRGMNDNFGEQLSISGNYAIIGAMQDGEDASGANTMTNSGSAYVFERNGAGAWNEVQKIVANDRAANDKFARSIAVSNGYALIGAAFEDDDAAGNNPLGNAGSVYIYERDGAGVWNQAQKIVASDRGFADNFGWSVAIDGNNAIVGANLEDEDGVGVNTMADAGSAYVFERNGAGVWNEVSKINASDRAMDDLFGASVGISGNNVIIGAYWEDHDGAGANFMDRSGSAYIFELQLATDIEEENNENIFTLYPNPTQGIVMIDLGNFYEEVHLVVMDVTGRIIIENNLKNINQHKIEIGNAPSGIYFITVKTGDKTSFSKLVKQ